METHFGIFGQKWLDIIFANRNKAYGAYVLRKEYDKNLLLGLLFTVVSLLFLLGIAALNPHVKLNHDVLVKGQEVILSNISPMEKPLAVPQTATPIAASSIDRSMLPPKIVDDRLIPDNLPIDKPETPSNGSNINGIGSEVPAVAGTGGIAAIETPDNTLYNFMNIELMPQFGDTEQDLMRYLAQNVKYPPQAVENNVSGKVYVQFVVDKEGSVTQIKVLRGVGSGLDEEAMRVIKGMPRWKPGKQNGRPVSVLYQLPIQFSLK